jgi:hypothetical protein
LRLVFLENLLVQLLQLNPVYLLAQLHRLNLADPERLVRLDDLGIQLGRLHLDDLGNLLVQLNLDDLEDLEHLEHLDDLGIQLGRLHQRILVILVCQINLLDQLHPVNLVILVYLVDLERQKFQ